MARLYVNDTDLDLWHGDALDTLRDLPTDHADCCITSPPYEDARPEYPGEVEWVAIMHELRRVVRGPALLNVGRLWRQGEEWLWWRKILVSLRVTEWLHLDTLVWIKPNANPIHGQVLANSHEYVLLLGRSADEFNVDAVRTAYAEGSEARLKRKWRHGTAVKGDFQEKDGREANPNGARPRSFVTVYTGKEKGNRHPAPMAEGLAEYLVKLGCPEHVCEFCGPLLGEVRCEHSRTRWRPGRVLDPFFGSGTTAVAARKLGRHCVGIEIEEAYCLWASERLAQQSLFAG